MCNVSKTLKPQDYALGRQMTIEYYDCDPSILADTKLMEALFLEAARNSGATIISSNFHGFEPQGVSGVVIIAESHFTVHAWPEHDYAAVDIFTCGETINFQVAVDSLKRLLKSEHTIVSSVMNRGIVNNNGIERFVPICEDLNNRYTLSWERRYNSTNATALMVSIDVYNLFGGKFFDTAEIGKFARVFIKDSEIFTENAVFFVEKREEDQVILLDVADSMNSLSGKFFLSDKVAYLDVFSCKYFEPRIAGELAINNLGGTNYRMQVAIRQ